MVAETYTYFIADTNLRAEYGGGAIVATAGDAGAEVSKEALCLRYICNRLNLPLNYTQNLFHVGLATGSIMWIRVPNTFYSTIEPYLTGAETGTATTTMPSGFTINSTLQQFQPIARGKTIFVRGDSISDGTGMDGTPGNEPLLLYCKIALDLLAGETTAAINSDKREFVSRTSWKLNQMALGGSSWGNTNVAGGDTNYPKREDLIFNQRIKTLPLNANANNIIFSYWLGTNDLAYGATGISGADVWARAVNRITAFKAVFPNVRVIMGTIIKRSRTSPVNGDATLNVINHDYNVLLRNNFKRLGVSAIFDFEGLVPQVNISTGDTTNRTYYTDYAHLTILTHGTLLAPIYRDTVNAAFAITLPPNPVLAVPTPTSTTIPLSWTMSDDTNIIDYDICYKVSNSDNWITFSDGVSTAKTATLTGLTSGTSYDVMVKAVRSVGSPTPVVDVSFSNVRTVTTA